MSRLWANDFDRTESYVDQYPKVPWIFLHPVAHWLGDKAGKKRTSTIRKRVTRLLDRAYPSTPVFVIYNLPNRDVGQYSKGGAKSISFYLEYVEDIAIAIDISSPILIFEPDGLPHANEMEPDEKASRLAVMQTAVRLLTGKSKARVYIDVGHSNWLSPKEAADLYNSVCNKRCQGFSVNVSNFRTTEESVTWAKEVSRLSKYRPSFVIDTSRNGNGPYGNEWCNPPGRGLGHFPTENTGIPKCDAFLWIKIPGESDGKRNGGKSAGTFCPKYATELIENSPNYYKKKLEST